MWWFLHQPKTPCSFYISGSISCSWSRASVVCCRKGRAKCKLKGLRVWHSQHKRWKVSNCTQTRDQTGDWLEAIPLIFDVQHIPHTKQSQTLSWWVRETQSDAASNLSVYWEVGLCLQDGGWRNPPLPLLPLLPLSMCQRWRGDLEESKVLTPVKTAALLKTELNPWAGDVTCLKLPKCFAWSQVSQWQVGMMLWSQYSLHRIKRLLCTFLGGRGMCCLGLH